MKPTVLVAGMKMPENQFTRGVRKLGADVIHRYQFNGTHRVPTADLAIVCLCQISHEDHYAVRDTFKAMGRPVIIANNSWVSIEEEVADEIAALKANKKPKVVKASEPEPPKYVAEANAAATYKIPDYVPVQEKKMEEQKPAEVVQMPKKKSSTTDAVRDLLAQGWNSRQITDELERRGIRKRDGTPIGIAHVCAIIANARRPRGQEKNVEELAPKQPVMNQFQLLEVVMKAPKLSAEQKVEFSQRILSGEIKSLVTTRVEREGNVLRLERFDITDPDNRISIDLDMKTAKLIAEHPIELEVYLAEMEAESASAAPHGVVA